MVRQSSCLLFIFVFFASPVFAGEKIKGAFGIELGQIFDVERSVELSFPSYREPMYSFHPKKKPDLFSSFFVLVTSKSHRVFRIHASGAFENENVCKKQRVYLMGILEDKYDTKFGFEEYAVLIQGDKYISVSCSGSDKNILVINYFDQSFRLRALYEIVGDGHEFLLGWGEIEGAFGLKFGDKFEVEDDYPNNYNFRLGNEYSFLPELKFPLFDEYGVQSTPSTNRIYEIRAWGSGGDYLSCKQEQSFLTNILRNKYGEGYSNGVHTLFERGNRTITLYCFGSRSSSILQIEYLDKKLQLKALRESMGK